MGQIEFGEFINLDGLQVQYNFVAGEDWNLSDGVIKGTSQYAFKGQGRQMNKMNWNRPFEVTYRTMTPFGWPQLVLYGISKDTEGLDVVKAYGCIHIPISPGIHTKKVRMFSPIANNSCFEFLGYH